jgi:hypothetical protein
MKVTRKKGTRAVFCATLALFLCAMPLGGVASAAALPDLVLDFSDTPDPVEADGQVFYQTEVYNDGDGVTPGPVKLSVQLAPGVTAGDVTFVTQFRTTCSASDGNGAGAIVTCFSTSSNMTSMAVGFRMSVPAGATSLSAAATVDPDNTIAEARETNNRRTSFTTVSSENSPPVSFAQTSPDPASGWSTSNVAVTLTGTDIGSGVKELHFRATGATLIQPSFVEGDVVTFELGDEGATMVSYYAVDRVGNVEATNGLLVRIDRTAPALACGDPSEGWSATNIEVACASTDDGSGLADGADASFTLSTTVGENEESDSARIDGRTVCDVAGNCSMVGPFEALKVDRRAPTVDVSAYDGLRFLLNANVTGPSLCSDGGSGIVSCESSAASTSVVGTHEIDARATDGVGHVTEAHASYEVTYGVCPITELTKLVSPGSTLSLKLSLCDANVANVSDRQIGLTSVEVRPVSSGASVSPAFELGGKRDDWKYTGAHGGSYSQNLSTKGLTGGTYELRFAVEGDPVMHSLTFQLRADDGTQPATKATTKGSTARSKRR